MSTLSKRVDKLDHTDNTHKYVFIFAEKGECSDAAIIRNGYDPKDAGNHYLVIQFVSPEEVRHAHP